VLEIFIVTPGYNCTSIQCNREPIELEADTAVPIGLFTNELLTKALKYPFGINKPGEIKIQLLPATTADKYIFEVTDNGIGKLKNNTSKGTGFGTKPVNLLVKQLDGEFTVTYSNGTHILIQFKHSKIH